MSNVAALFVEDGGIYFNREDIDPWGPSRNAKLYRGGSPVVAHPPCQLWGKFAKINYARWGGEHNKPGNDGGCFKFAKNAVEKWGGVLEHPAQSYAWEEYRMTKPEKYKWIPCNKRGSWVCEVWQSAYGHLCNKATWLYYVGLTPPFELDWSRPKGTHQIGFRDQRGKGKNKPTVSGKKASATPPAFQEILISLARHSINPTDKGERL